MGILFPEMLADEMSLKPGPCNVGRGHCLGAWTLEFLEEVIALEPGPWTKFRDGRHALRMFRRPRHPNVVLFHGAAPLPETFEFALVMERVQGVTLDVLAALPPRGLDSRHCCKIILDFYCALVSLRSMAPQLVHGTPKIPMPLLRPHGIGASMSSC